MAIQKLPKSLRKHIRTEKARIRREFFDFQRQQELISKLYEDMPARYPKRELQKDKLTKNIISAAAENVLSPRK